MARSFLLLSLLLLPLFGLSSPGRAQQQPENSNSQPARSTGAERLLRVAVTDDKCAYVLGLPPDAFAVYEGKTQLKIISFNHEDDPASIGLVIDQSGSMLEIYKKGRKSKANFFQDAVSKFFELGHPSNDYFVLSFDDSPQILLDPTTDRDAVLLAFEKFFSTPPKGSTALLDACYAGVNKVLLSPNPKRAIIAVSDWQDNASSLRLKELKNLLKEQDVLFYPIVIKVNTGASVLQELWNTSRFEDLAEASGGKSFTIRTDDDLNQAMMEIAADLRVQYEIGISLPEPARKDGWHKLEVRVSGPRNHAGQRMKVHARAREGYSIKSAKYERRRILNPIGLQL
jgi:Ca-activated chloride channel homolog